MKIVIPHGFGLGEEAMAKLEAVARVVVLGDPSEESLLAEIGDADALLVGIAPRVTESLMQRAPRLRHIARQGVGVDIVDVKAATKRGIVVTNVPDVTSNSVAEFTMTLLLSVAKNIVHCDRAVKEGHWDKRLDLSRTNLELYGKTHGVVGLGRIGGRVAIRCQAFGMRVLYFQRNRNPEMEKAGIAYAPLAVLIRQSDSISLHLPLSKETVNMIDTPQFDSMKRGVLLINQSRGTVVNQAALVLALREGRVGGYGTDVYDREPPDPKHELFGFGNVVASPHLGGGTRETRARANMVLAEDVIRVLKGEPPKNLVDDSLVDE
jgi:D-3-phosphoglycerate dehydrogenase